MSHLIKKLVPVVLLLILSFTIVEGVRAVVLTPGVVPGNTFEYEVTAFWSSSDEYASIPASLVDINRTETIEVRISAVVGSNVSIFVAVYYKNQTQFGGHSSVDVDTGLDSGGPFVAIIAGNLQAQDVVHPLGGDYFRINETVIKAYESGSRETNRILIEHTNATTGTSGRFDRYFDKATGILVESYETTTSTNPETTTTISWNIKSSNVWVIPEFPSLLILPIFMIAMTIVVIVYKKKNTNGLKPLVYK